MPAESTSLTERMRAASIRRSGLKATFQLESRLRGALGRATRWLHPVREPMFLWGAGKTGSYLLYDMLSLHPDVVCPRGIGRESKGLFAGIKDQHTSLGFGEVPYAPIEGAKRFVLRQHPDAPARTTWAEAEKDDLRERYQRLLGERLRSGRVCDKAPHYTFLVDLIDELFPDARHVQIVRHPYRVVHINRMREPDALNPDGSWGTPPPGWADTAHLSFEDRAAWLALETMTEADRQATRLGSRCTTSTYESLVADTHSQVRRILAHLDLAETPILPEALPKSFSDRATSLSNVAALSAPLRARLDEVTLQLGYEPLVVDGAAAG